MWIEPEKPHMWDGEPRAHLHVGSSTVAGTVSHCGEIRQNLSTGYPQGETLFRPFHILDRVAMAAHIWGANILDVCSPDWTSPQGKVLIHKKSRVIHISSGSNG